MLKILVPVSLLGLLALAPIAQARATHSNPDHYIYIPPRYDISCGQARVLLKKDGYRIAKPSNAAAIIINSGPSAAAAHDRAGHDGARQTDDRCAQRLEGTALAHGFQLTCLQRGFEEEGKETEMERRLFLTGLLGVAGTAGIAAMLPRQALAAVPMGPSPEQFRSSQPERAVGRG